MFLDVASAGRVIQGKINACIIRAQRNAFSDAGHLECRPFGKERETIRPAKITSKM